MYDGTVVAGMQRNYGGVVVFDRIEHDPVEDGLLDKKDDLSRLALVMIHEQPHVAGADGPSPLQKDDYTRTIALPREFSRNFLVDSAAYFFKFAASR